MTYGKFLTLFGGGKSNKKGGGRGTQKAKAPAGVKRRGFPGKATNARVGKAIAKATKAPAGIKRRK